MVTPAPAVTWPDAASTGSSPVSRLADRITGSRPAGSGGGTEPPTRPVFPPCGMTGTRWAAQARITSATSLVDPGLTTQLAMPA